MFLMFAGVLTAGLINRSLGPSGRGILGEMQTWVEMFAVLFGISVDTAIYHLANKVVYGVGDDRKFVNAAALVLVYSALASVVLVGLVIFKPEYFSPQAVQYILLLDILVVFTMMGTNLTTFYQAMGDIRFAAMISMAQAGMATVVIGGGYLLGLLDLKCVVISLIAVQGVALLILGKKSAASGYFRGGLSSEVSRKIVSVGLRQHVATISTFLYTKVNLLIVFRYCGDSEAGLFAVPLNLVFFFMVFPATFQLVLYPRVIHSTDDFEVTVKSLRYGFYGWGAAVILLAVLAKPILLVYGGIKFLPSVRIFRVLLVATWLLPLSSLIAPYYVKAGAFGLASLSAVVLGAIGIGLNLVLVPRYASMGAALSTSLTCLVGFCMALTFLFLVSNRNPLTMFRPDFSGGRRGPEEP